MILLEFCIGRPSPSALATRLGGHFDRDLETTIPQNVAFEMTFADFFQAATGNAPYGYQCRLACADDARSDKPTTLAAGCECRSRLINIPTGLGKTATVVLAWLWNRVVPFLDSQASLTSSAQWPRRLIYCLPMRALVEQTEREITKWLRNLSKNAGELGLVSDAKRELEWLAAHSPVILMGGEELTAEKRDWHNWPEKPAILVGTQDMLLSRALNRGYGMSRYRWPMHFGLLNNDALWVMDETQLMGVGVETSAQLDAFRARFDTFGTCATWWMSATLDSTRLATVDQQPLEGWRTICLEQGDLSRDDVKERVGAKRGSRRV